MKKHVATGVIALTLGLSGVLPTVPSVLNPVQVEAASASKSYTAKNTVDLKVGRHSKGKTLVKIPKGKTLTYVKAFGSWTQVKYAGKIGYIPTRDISVTTKTPTTVTKSSVSTTYTTNKAVDLKSGRHSKNKTLVKIPKGKTVTYVKAYGSWSQVKYGSQTGYLATSALTKKTVTKPATPAKPVVKTFYATTDLAVKSGRHSSNATVVTVPKGKQVTFVKDFGSWTQVKYGTKSGYVATKSLSTTPPKTTTVPAPPVTSTPKPQPTPAPTPAPVAGKMRAATSIYADLTKAGSPWSHQSKMFKVESKSYGKVLSYFNKDLRIAVTTMDFSTDTKQFSSAAYSVKDWMRPTSLSHYEEGVKNALLVTDATADAIFGKGSPESKAYATLLKKEFDLQVKALKKNEEINAVYKPYSKNFTTKIGQTPIEIDAQDDTLRVYFN